MLFRQLFDPQSSTYTYLLADEGTGEALLIDTVFEQATRDIALLAELELKLVACLETHVHADHVTGAWLLKERLGSHIALSKACGAEGAPSSWTEAGPPDRMTPLGARRSKAAATGRSTASSTRSARPTGSK